jgi:hypothetical protein
MSVNRRETMRRLVPLAIAWLAVASSVVSDSTRGRDHPSEQNRGDAGGHETRPFRAGIVVSDSQRSLDSGRTRTRFQLPALRELYVRVQVAHPPPAARLELVFINPNGERFFEDRALFSRNRSVVTIDDPVLGPATRAFPIKPIPGGVALDRAIPIAGTIFTRVPMPDGEWTVQATVSGVPGVLTTTLELSWGR